MNKYLEKLIPFKNRKQDQDQSQNAVKAIENWTDYERSLLNEAARDGIDITDIEKLEPFPTSRELEHVLDLKRENCPPEKLQFYLNSQLDITQMQAMDKAMESDIPLSVLNPDFSSEQMEAIISRSLNQSDITPLTRQPLTPMELRILEDELAVEQLQTQMQNSVMDSLKSSASLQGDFSDNREMISRALAETLQGQNYRDLEENFQLITKIDSDARVMLTPQYYRDEIPHCSDCSIQACKELLGNIDLETRDPYGTAMGYYEVETNMVKALESAVFGKWISSGFEGPYEKGHFDLDDTNPFYREYKDEQMKLTIKKVCDQHPEFVFEYLHVDDDLTARFYQNFDHDYTSEDQAMIEEDHRISEYQNEVQKSVMDFIQEKLSVDGTFSENRELITAALTDALQSEDYDTASQHFSMIKNIEKTANAELAPRYSGRSYLNHSSYSQVACEELLGEINLRAAYPYDSYIGTFTFGEDGWVDNTEYLENVAFGQWVENDIDPSFEEYSENEELDNVFMKKFWEQERGHYELHANSPDYRSYKAEQMNLTIQKVCDHFPEFVLRDIQSDTDLVTQFYENFNTETIKQQRTAATDFSKNPKLAIAPLMETLDSHDYETLQQRYAMLNQIEQQVFEESRPGSENLYPYKNSSCQMAAKELLGDIDLSVHFPTEANNGAFDGLLDPTEYYEQVAFGKQIPFGFNGPNRDIFYEVDETSSAYRQYKTEQMKLTIKKVCEKYPEIVLKDIQSDPELSVEFNHHLEPAPQVEPREIDEKTFHEELSNNTFANFSKCTFSHLTLSSEDTKYASFDDAHFSYCKFKDFDGQHSNFENARFSDCQFENSNFSHANLKNTTFVGCKTTDTDFSYANLSSSYIRDSLFSTGTNLTAVDFIDARMYSANMHNTEVEKSPIGLDRLTIKLGGARGEEVESHRSKIMNALTPPRGSEYGDEFFDDYGDYDDFDDYDGNELTQDTFKDANTAASRFCKISKSMDSQTCLTSKGGFEL